MEEMMLERGIHVDHSNINRWVIDYASLFENGFIKMTNEKAGSS